MLENPKSELRKPDSLLFLGWWRHGGGKLVKLLVKRADLVFVVGKFLHALGGFLAADAVGKSLHNVLIGGQSGFHFVQCFFRLADAHERFLSEYGRVLRF